MDTVDYSQKFKEYYQKWGGYAPGTCEEDWKLVAHICSELEHEYPGRNLFQELNWRFYYDKGFGAYLKEDALKNFGITKKTKDELEILKAIKSLKPYARIYRTDDGEYGYTWCIVWPDDPALQKEDDTLFYIEGWCEDEMFFTSVENL